MTRSDLSPPSAPRRPAWLAVAGLLALVAILFSFRLGQDVPLSSHEALLAETARNMVLDHPVTRPDGSQPSPYLVPNFNGSDRLKKTPLPYWTVAGLARLTGGVDEWTARLPAAVTGVRHGPHPPAASAARGGPADEPAGRGGPGHDGRVPQRRPAWPRPTCR